MTSNTSKFLFPLRTNVEYFASPASYLSLIERVKQASLLYDKLIFEEGVYTAIVWEGGVYETRIPEHLTSEEMLTNLKDDFTSRGGEALFEVAPSEEGPFLPVLSGNVTQRFFCEFHTLLRSVGIEQLPWVELETFKFTSEGEGVVKRVKEDIAKDVDAIIPPMTKALQDTILTNLSKDLILSSVLQIPACMAPLYAPILHRRVEMVPAPGFAALQVALPNLADLHWQKILELREQECLIAFRQKLIEVEESVRKAMENQAIDEVQRQLSLAQTINQELTEQLAIREPKLSESIGNVLLDLVFSLIPIPGLSTIMTGLREGIKHDDARQSWVTAFIKLKAH